MVKRKTILAAGLTALVVVTTAACGESDPDPAGEPSRNGLTSTRAVKAPTEIPDVDAAVVRGGRMYDYAPARSLSALADRHPVAVLGEVVGWTDGRSVVETDGAFTDTSLYGVLEVKVTETYSGEVSDGTVFVEVERGGQVRIEGKPPVPSINKSLAELNEAVPAGARVIVVGAPAPTDSEHEAQNPAAVVEGVGEGLPAGATFLWPSVQGLLFEDEDGSFVSGEGADKDQWGWLPADMPVQDEFNELVTELDALDRR